MPLPRVTGATEASGSIRANADESAVKVHKVTFTSSTLPLPSLLRPHTLEWRADCDTSLSHAFRLQRWMLPKAWSYTGPACTSQHPHMSSSTLHCSQHVLMGIPKLEVGLFWFLLLLIEETALAKKGRSSKKLIAQHAPCNLQKGKKR